MIRNSYLCISFDLREFFYVEIDKKYICSPYLIFVFTFRIRLMSMSNWLERKLEASLNSKLLLLF